MLLCFNFQGEGVHFFPGNIWERVLILDAVKKMHGFFLQLEMNLSRDDLPFLTGQNHLPLEVTKQRDEKLTVGMMGGFRLPFRSPSQLNPSNHLCFWTSFTPPLPTPRRSVGLSLEKQEVYAVSILWRKTNWSMFSATNNILVNFQSSLGHACRP